MFDMLDVMNIKETHRLNSSEIEICFGVANEFNNKDLIKSAFQLEAYIKNDKLFLNDDVSDFIDNWFCVHYILQ